MGHRKNLYALPAFLAGVALSVLPARAVDISTHSFSSCGFPDTGQKVCYGATGGTTSCPAPNAGLAQDGTYIPSAAQPKYTIYKLTADSSVTVDDRTGLMWITNPNNEAPLDPDNCTWESCSWTDALTACEGKDYAGFTDWRLPNVRELMSIVNYQNYEPSINTTAFLGQIYGEYWTSTPLTTYCEGETCYWYDAWIVNFSDGRVSSKNKPDKVAVRCVRGGPPL